MSISVDTSFRIVGGTYATEVKVCMCGSTCGRACGGKVRLRGDNPPYKVSTKHGCWKGTFAPGSIELVSDNSGVTITSPHQSHARKARQKQKGTRSASPPQPSNMSPQPPQPSSGRHSRKPPRNPPRPPQAMSPKASGKTASRPGPNPAKATKAPVKKKTTAKVQPQLPQTRSPGKSAKVQAQAVPVQAVPVQATLTKSPPRPSAKPQKAPAKKKAAAKVTARPSPSSGLVQPFLTSRPRPDVVIFDLDYTLWPYFADEAAKHPPLRATDHTVGARGYRATSVVDEKYIYQLYPDVPSILCALQDAGVTMAIASRSRHPDEAKMLLKLIRIVLPNGKEYRLEQMFSFMVIQPGMKLPHMRMIKKGLKVDLYDHMLFFDDDLNNRVVGQLGVMMYHLDPKGMTWQKLEDGFRMWRASH